MRINLLLDSKAEILEISIYGLHLESEGRFLDTEKHFAYQAMSRSFLSI